MRGTFSKAVLDLLFKRAGGHCSNPNCTKETSGPSSDINKVVMIGEGAHICAASPGGPRYDAEMTEAERNGVNNGIWLCANCHKMVDSDPESYSVKLLHQWKENAESLQHQRLNQSMYEKIRPAQKSKSMNDVQIFLKALKCRYDLYEYAYQYGKANFNDRCSTKLELERYLLDYGACFQSDLDDMLKKIGDADENEYRIFQSISLKLGGHIASKYNMYSKLFQFKFSHDSIGLYDDYYACFFMNLFQKYHKIRGCYHEIVSDIYEKFK